jgi:choline dehydrogenase-like flavoprotein
VRREAFHALRKLTMLAYASGPEARAIWDAIGYPGPIGALADPSPATVVTLDVGGDARLSCDVVVVGSGAGGAVAAAVLARAGLDVVVVEMGEHLTDGDFDGDEARGLADAYLEGGAAQTRDGSVALLAGSCLGGGTVVNYTTSFATPQDVRAEWASHGVAAFASAAFDDSLARVSSRIGVSCDEGRPSRRDELLRRGLDALGWHVDAIPRNTVGCDQGASCGYCGYGCRLGAKQSTLKTFLPDAVAAGARVLVRTRVTRILHARGAATGVEARTADGHAVTIAARTVVLAAGALHTPVLIQRSGLANPRVGRGLRVHPVLPVFGLFDEDVAPWTGTMQALYSDQHRDLHGGYGVKYETAAVHPALVAAFLPWRSAATHAAVLRRISRLSPVGILLRDHGAGTVGTTREGEPDVRYAVSALDAAHLRVGVEGAARILEEAGARWIGSTHVGAPSYEPGRAGARDSFLAAVDRDGFGAGKVGLVSFHLMGSAAMGGSASTSACDPEGALRGVRGVVVCDGSTFPTASGVNPMVTIEAIADMNARALAAGNA